MTKPPAPASICGYPIVDKLRDAETYLARIGNRRIVLKKLDPDCLIGDGTKLHPAIRDRLTRIQQLADTQVANFYGIERGTESANAGAFMLWEFAAGETLHAWAQRTDLTKSQLLTFVTDLIACVAGLHAWGIVHGAIHANNIIVDDKGRAKLTHVSPLLYTEPQADSVALAEVMYNLAEAQGSAVSELQQFAEQLLQSDADLRVISSRTAFALEDQPLSNRVTGEPAGERFPAARTKVLALITVILLIFVAALGLGKWVRHETIATPTPPDAPANALQP